MEIKKDLTKDFSNDFEELKKSIASTNYNVSFSARTFAYENNPNLFDLNCFRKIYHDEVKQECNDDCSARHTNKDFRYRCISGSLDKTTIATCISEINTALTFDSDLCNSLLFQQPKSIIEIALQKRIQTFWDTIEQHFSISASTQTWSHKPDFMSFFQWGVMWEFCFIFINNETNQGLVLAGSAFD